jgi:hypothetical protein
MKNISDLSDKEINKIVARLIKEAMPRLKQVKSAFESNILDGTDAWYQASYDVFVGGKARDYDQFVRAVAYAYSWVATIPKAAPRDSQVRAIKKAAEIAMRDTESRADLLQETRAALRINGKNSYVVVSKVLHFWDPTLAPMIDSWVYKALEELNIRRPAYIEYWRFADRAIRLARESKKISNLDYRLLDELLFQFGRSRAPRPRRVVVRHRRTAPERARAAESSGYATKIAHARAIMKTMEGRPRSDVLDKLVNVVGLTPAGASTYYSNIKHEV